MSLTQELRQRHHDLWERMTTHPFVQELGADTLPLEKFQRYFLQDYLFLRDFTGLLALGVAKAPDMESARRLAQFLAEVLQGEEQLFRGSFREWALRPEQYARPEPAPVAASFGNLMTRVAYEGSFAEILTLLVVSEWGYLDWATRLAQAGRLQRRRCTGPGLISIPTTASVTSCNGCGSRWTASPWKGSNCGESKSCSTPPCATR